MTTTNELTSTSKSPWTPQLLQLAITGKYPVENDIREQ